MCRRWNINEKLCRWWDSGIEDTAHPKFDGWRVANAIDLDSQSALNMDRLEMIRVLLEDVCGSSTKFYLWMCVRWRPCIRSGSRSAAVCVIIWRCLTFRWTPKVGLRSAGGMITNGNIAGVHPFKTASDKDFRQGVSEDVAHAYYQGGKPLHPWMGETEPEFTGWNAEQNIRG